MKLFISYPKSHTQPRVLRLRSLHSQPGKRLNKSFSASSSVRVAIAVKELNAETDEARLVLSPGLEGTNKEEGGIAKVVEVDDWTVQGGGPPSYGTIPGLERLEIFYE